jgi:hypothetical protein
MGNPAGPMRFLKTALIGGAVGGVVASIPVLNLLTCCFCLPNLLGVFLGLSLYFRENPEERIPTSDAAISGAMSGLLCGVLAAVLGLIINVVLGSLMATLFNHVPPELRRAMAQSAAGGVFGIFIYPLIYGGWGALGGFLAMELFHKDRKLG